MGNAGKETLSGRDVRGAFAAANAWLERHAESVNAINVFPVPDGDTGTNMSLTMRSTMAEAAKLPEEAIAGQVLEAMSRGALMGARGNSGVILSQLLRGLAAGCAGREALDASSVVQGLEQAAETAYKAVPKPVEGTILTVAREAAAGGRQALKKDTALVSVMEAVVSAARRSVEDTPKQLPVLAEAGVVDAGGQGLFILLEGLLRYFKGEKLEELSLFAGIGAIEQDWLAVTQRLHQQEPSRYGYCTEFLVRGEGLVMDAAHERMELLGDSVLVVGDERLLRLHVHTDDPGAALNYGTGLGTLVQVKVDNMAEQAERFLEAHNARAVAATEPVVIALVAVVAGQGLERVMLSIGVTAVVPGGPSMNPSAREILEAVEACPSDQVIVLPNDKNILMAAQQAAELSEKRVEVVPTRSVPQGLAAALALNPEQSIEENAAAMVDAVKHIRTIEVCRAVRDASVHGVKVREGDVIAIVDDELKLAADSPEEALVEALATLPLEGASLVTLYYGADTDGSAGGKAAWQIASRVPQLEVEVVYGGQPHYFYIASVE